MDMHKTIASQFHAALLMLEQTVRICPHVLWDDSSQANPFWRVAYHALFYSHLYLQPTEDEFSPWEHSHGRDGYQFLGPTPWPPHTQPVADQPYSREEILAYSAFCRAEVERLVPTLDLMAQSGFHWLPFDKLELQLYSIRHLQQHVGELSGYLLAQAGLEIDWIGMEPGRRAE